MKNNKCIICLKVKGRRICKIKGNSSICPRCCAEIKNSDCDGCSYYAQAERYAVEKMKKSGFKNFIAKFDPEVDKAVDNALTYVEKGKIEKGEKILLGLIKKHPDLYIVQYGMGTVMAMKGKDAEALIYFDKCLEQFPYCVEAWFNKGAAHKNVLDIGKALKAFQKVIEFGPPKDPIVKTARDFLSDTEARIIKDTGLSLDAYFKFEENFDQAFSYMRNKQYEKAITIFNELLEANKDHVQSHGNLGICYAFLGKRQEALSAFDRALELDPNYAPAKQNRDVLLSLKKGEKMPEVQTEVVAYYKDVIESESNR
jgi:tetratricopeptide (TPR) repeat protein